MRLPKLLAKIRSLLSILQEIWFDSSGRNNFRTSNVESSVLCVSGDADAPFLVDAAHFYVKCPTRAI